MQAPLSSPPPAYMEIIVPLITKAREFLEAGKTLQAMPFVGNLTSRNIMPVSFEYGSSRPEGSK